MIFLYFKNAKYDYGRYILLSNNSIIKYLLPEDILIDSNLDILKIVDLKIYIKLVVLSNRYIKKGEKLNINNKIIFNLWLFDLISH